MTTTLHLMCENIFDTSSLSDIGKHNLVVSTTKFLFGLPVTQYNKEVRGILGPKARVIDMRQAIKRRGYVMKNLKLWLYATYFKAGPSQERALKEARQFGVKRRDLPLIEIMQEQSVVSHMKSLKHRYRPVSVQTVNRFMEEAVAELTPYTKRFAHKKLRFMTGAHRSLEDLSNELLLLGIQAFMVQYPRFESRLHAINTMKTAIHNFGMNEIKTNNRECRGNLVKCKDGTFESRAVSYELMLEVNPAFVEGEGNKDEVSDSLEKLVEKYKGKKKQFILCMAGINKKFDRYLANKGYDDDSFIANKGIDQYVEEACYWLNVPREKADALLAKVGVDLGVSING